MSSDSSLEKGYWVSMYSDGGRYKYNSTEKFVMMLLNVPTNFSSLPALVIFYRKRMLFQFFVGVFTSIVSIMYHLCDSIAAERIFMTEYEWHQLDNIGSIVCFTMLIAHWADYRNEIVEPSLNLASLFIAIILQMAHPWDIWYTVGPIVFFFALNVGLKYFYEHRWPVLNMRMIKRACLLMALGVVFFLLATDEFKDYLRFSHGLWHVMIGSSSFYTWQAKHKPHEELTLRQLWHYKPIFDSKYSRVPYKTELPSAMRVEDGEDKM